MGDEVGFFTGVDNDGLIGLGMGKEIAVGLKRPHSKGGNFHDLILTECLKEEKVLLRNQLG